MHSTAVLYTGGKDSTRAIEMLKRLGHEVSCLITIYSENLDSYMLHTANIKLVELSAQALEIPLYLGTTKGNKEEELEDVKSAILRAKDEYGFEVLGSGGLASNYQKTRIEKIANDCGVASICPMWGVDQRNYLNELVVSGYRFVLTSVSAGGLDESWLGLEIDNESVVRLTELSKKFNFNAALEGGEGETLVLDCPIYPRKKLKLIEYTKRWDGYRGKLEITKAELEMK
ncbi:MAG: diphthine--ammonia ligase [Nitrososphaerota archaeon]|nr:diphthine--ammonia ligase [Nitrososphaerota archaeon]MDG6922757.1 diphthine--ammonia ligase [Nitrososphaerota archaeon]